MLVICLIFTAILGVLAVVLAANLIMALTLTGLSTLKAVLLFVLFILVSAGFGVMIAEAILLIFR